MAKRKKHRANDGHPSDRIPLKRDCFDTHRIRRTLPLPQPFSRNLTLLWVSTVLLVAWLVFLIIMVWAI